MEYEICLEPSGVRFKADESQNIVEAAKAHHVAIKHGCASGSCGDCKGTILSGESEQGPFMPLLLLPTERAAGMAILCKLYPRSNLRLQAEVISGDVWNTEIVGLSKLAWNVLELRLRPEKPYPYRTGQYARMAVPGQEPWLPPWVQLGSHHLHCLMHSAPVAGLVTLIVWAVRRAFWIPLIGWWLHIVIDVFTHSADYYAVPVLYPITMRGFDGEAWNTPWFMALNYLGLAAVWLWLWRSGPGRPQDSACARR